MRCCRIAESSPAWVALLTSLVSFGFTLHLPAHFLIGQPGFQFEFDKPWIKNPTIHYHVAVDGLSLWLVVLTGLLAPVGVLASWNAIKERRKVYYSLFMLQQTAMFGVFVSLDLMVYYGFWELSLVPMAILIAMYGRKDGAHAAGRFFLFTFIPSAPLLVAILYLYARTGSFDFGQLQYYIGSGAIPAGALFWCGLAFLFAFAVKVPVFPLHGWLAETFSEAPVALAMVVAGKLGLYSMLRFHVGLFPVQTRAIAPLMIALAVIGILYGACLALVQRDFWRLIAFATLGHFSVTTLGIYGLNLIGRDGAVFLMVSQGVIEGALFVLLGVLETRYATSQIAQLRRSGGEASAHGYVLCDHVAGDGGAAAAQWIRGRIPGAVEHVYFRQPGMGDCRDCDGDSGRQLHAVAGAAAVLWAAERHGGIAAREGSRAWRVGGAGPAGGADAGDGGRAELLAAVDREEFYAGGDYAGNATEPGSVVSHPSGKKRRENGAPGFGGRLRLGALSQDDELRRRSDERPTTASASFPRSS